MASTQFEGHGYAPLTQAQRDHNQEMRLKHSGTDDGICIRRSSNGEVSVVSTSRALQLIEHGEVVPQVIEVKDSKGVLVKEQRHVKYPVELAE